MIYDLPPTLKGTPQMQLRQIHDYLVRLARQQQMESNVATTQGEAIQSTKSGVTRKDIEALQTKAGLLKDLIIKTATETYEQAIGESERIMESVYLAKSDFGIYQEEIYTRIEETAQQIRESFDYAALVQSIGDIESYLNVVHGEIRRGFIPNPVQGEAPVTFGIVISTRNVFSANENEWTPEGEEFSYSEIQSDERFGIYTANGWEYWHGGLKQWWFDALDGLLHARSIVIEQRLQLANYAHIGEGAYYGIKGLGV